MERRFEVVPTITGAEVYDTISGRPVDSGLHRWAAAALAERLNRTVGGLAPAQASKLLATEWSSS